MDAQLIQGEEVLAAEVAAVTQLLLVALDVVEERLQLLEGLSAALHHTLVHLGEEGRAGGVAQRGNKQGKSSASTRSSLPSSEIIATGHSTEHNCCPLVPCAGEQLS